MSTSYVGAPVRFDETEHGYDRPFSAHVAQFLANNALSLADQNAQVRAAWESHDPANVYMTTRTPGAIGRFYKIVELGPFPLLVREDMVPYSARVRIAGYVNQANSVTFRAKLAPTGSPEADVLAATTTRPEIILEASTSSVSHAWLSPGDTLVAPVASDAGIAAVQISTYGSVGGAPVSVSECLFSLSIYASTTNTSTIPRLSGYYLAEYHPP